MVDFKFVQDSKSGKWVISAPRRANRPDIAKGFEPPCPFCKGRERDEQEVYRVGGEAGDNNWQVRVIPNKFPFAPIHEVIIHSPDHSKNFDELSFAQTEVLLKTYRQRYQTHQQSGQVYIFHNHGKLGGESLPHPHTQLAVIPESVKLDIPQLADPMSLDSTMRQESDHFILFCPQSSQWPDEVWVSPKKQGRVFGELSDDELSDLAFVLARLIRIMDLRHGNEFPFNFYIYPKGNWYLRLIPRLKTLGGFEVGTGVFVNTQDPIETIKFIKEHFVAPNEEKIRQEHQAKYHHSV